MLSKKMVLRVLAICVLAAFGAVFSSIFLLGLAVGLAIIVCGLAVTAYRRGA
jgi:hypothetical protein